MRDFLFGEKIIYQNCHPLKKKAEQLLLKHFGFEIINCKIREFSVWFRNICKLGFDFVYPIVIFFFDVIVIVIEWKYIQLKT